MNNKRLRRFVVPACAALAGLLRTSLVLAAEPQPVLPNVSIAFAADGGIRNWEADGERGLWIQGRNGSWYYARFGFPCTGLQYREALAFRFGPGGELDRWGEVRTRDAGRCPFTSLTASAGPPQATRHKPTAPAASDTTPAATK